MGNALRPIKEIFGKKVEFTPDKEAWVRMNYVKILYDDAVANNEVETLDWPYWLWECNIMKLHLTARKIIEDREASAKTEEGIILPSQSEIMNVLENKKL